MNAIVYHQASDLYVGVLKHTQFSELNCFGEMQISVSCLHFVSFTDTERVQVIQICPQWRKETSCIIWSISCLLLMSWQRHWVWWDRSSSTGSASFELDCIEYLLPMGRFKGWPSDDILHILRLFIEENDIKTVHKMAAIFVLVSMF